jgi:hypothetical protein
LRPIKSIPATLKYEPGTSVAEGDLVIVHARFSGFGAPENWIVADILRIKDGILVTQEQSKSGLPMFGTTFPPVENFAVGKEGTRLR